ncbi:hypothetical protein HPDFL43_00013040 [Hoeflea phototrophica DFL-43]|uniref:Uncharacterized protein n=1 Tax=Hoeflea phototrophica (strain DSM 17068 / NCIMB 14078 / DFL-43) TaxID=411684 RepID=A0A095BE27_HOEPD|nr:hypothetical protein HPDFL43_00013040 [Hoeflea phototrophica DFL-43]
MPIYPKPNTSSLAKGHTTFPDLLKGLRGDRANCPASKGPSRGGHGLKPYSQSQNAR